MKKMMMMVAVMLIAGLSQAAAVAWNSGAIKSVADASGAFGANVGAKTGIYLAQVYFYSDEAGTMLVTTTGTSDNSTSAASVFNGTTGSEFSPNGTYWAKLLVTTESPYGAASMESSLVSFTVPGTAAGSINFLSAGAMPSQWTVVPEPTSMALLALGIAALGLRRKNS